MSQLVTSNFDLTRIRATQASKRRAWRVFPFYWVEAAVVCSDAILVAASSVLTGIAYYFAVFHRVGPVEVFLGVGVLSFVNFSAILAARGSYQPQNLTNFWRQFSETTVVWFLVFFVLLAVGFLLKVSDAHSRGATLAFFIVGLAVLLGWRFVVARLLARALDAGAFAERKAILLAQQGATSRLESRRGA